MSGLRISPAISLPIDVAGEAIAILAKRGAGKTNTGRVLVEELHAAHVQTVVLDPVGAWWGLRSSADGKREGLPLPILGGAHGDVPLEPTAGRLLADVVVETGQSLVLDLSDFSKTQQRQFVVEFAERLYTRKARQRELLHLVLEESDEFVPQIVRAGDARMVGAIEQLVRRGRGRGIGLTMISQRSASLNKAVLEQADVLLAMRTTGPRDRAAIEAWVAKQDVEGADDVLPSLSSLETGEAWVWNPEHGILQRVRIRLATTFDSSSTPKPGQKRIAPRTTATIDLTSLGEQIAATAEKAKANDPRELQKHVRELEAKASNLEGKIALLERATAREPETVETIIEVPVLNGQVEQLERGISALREVSAELASVGASIFATAETIAAAIASTKQIKDPPRDREHPPRRRETPATTRVSPPAAAAPPRAAAGTLAEGVSGPQQRILNALAALEQIGVTAPDKTQLALFAEASPKSSSYSNNLGHLNNQLGLVRYPQPGRVQLTDEGRQIANAGAAPQSVDELHRYVAGLVGSAKWRLLEQLTAQYPAALEKNQLAELAGASPNSSSFSNNLGSLRSLGLIDYPAPGKVVALPVLFMEAT